MYLHIRWFCTHKSICKHEALYTHLIFLHICCVHALSWFVLVLPWKSHSLTRWRWTQNGPMANWSWWTPRLYVSWSRCRLKEGKEFLASFLGRVHFSKLSLDGCIKVVFMKSNKETARFLQDHSRWFCFFITMVLRSRGVVETWFSWSGWKVPSGLPEGIYLSPKPFTEDV